MFLDFSELYELFVGVTLPELLELSKTLNVVALDTSEVTARTDLRNNPCPLNTLSKTTNDVRAAFVVILSNLYVGCHMWA